VAQGSPVLVALSDGHYAAAKGVNAVGMVVIHDPSPDSRKSTLDEYLAAGATIAAAVHFAPRAPSTTGFLITSTSQPSIEIASVAGSCGQSVDLPQGSVVTRFLYCDGAQPVYQLS